MTDIPAAFIPPPHVQASIDQTGAAFSELMTLNVKAANAATAGDWEGAETHGRTLIEKLHQLDEGALRNLLGIAMSQCLALAIEVKQIEGRD